MARGEELARLSVPVEVDVSKLNHGLNGIQSKLGNFTEKLSRGFSRQLTTAISGAFTSMKLVGAGALLGAGMGVGKVISDAITLPFRKMGDAIADSMGSEAINRKFKAVFSETTADAEKFAVDLAKKLGRSSTEMKAVMSRTQDTLVPVGFDRDKATDMTKTLTMLSADLATFEGMAQTEVMDRIVSGMVGNHEAVRRFGVQLGEVSINAKLMEQGIKGGYKAATEQEKMLARLNIVLESTKDAHGSAAARGGSLAMELGGLAGVARELSSTFGDIFKPSLAAIVKFMREMVVAVQANIGPVDEWAERLKTATTNILENMRPMMDFFMNAEQQISGVFGEMVKWVQFASKDWETFGMTVSIVKDVIDSLLNIGVDLFFETVTKGIAAISGGVLGLIGVSDKKIRKLFVDISDMIASLVEMLEQLASKAGGTASVVSKLVLSHGGHAVVSSAMGSFFPGGGNLSGQIRDKASGFMSGASDGNNGDAISRIVNGMRAALDGVESGAMGKRAGEAYTAMQDSFNAMLKQRDAELAAMDAKREADKKADKPNYSLPGLDKSAKLGFPMLLAEMLGIYGRRISSKKNTEIPQVQFAGLEDIQKNIQTQLGGKQEEKDRRDMVDALKTIATKAGEQLGKLDMLPSRLRDSLGSLAAVLD